MFCEILRNFYTNLLNIFASYKPNFEISRSFANILEKFAIFKEILCIF